MLQSAGNQKEVKEQQFSSLNFIAVFFPEPMTWDKVDFSDFKKISNSVI